MVFTLNGGFSHRTSIIRILKSSFFEKKINGFTDICARLFCTMINYDGSFLGFKVEPKLRFPDKCRPSLFVL